jgi:hypothetical protein
LEDGKKLFFRGVLLMKTDDIPKKWDEIKWPDPYTLDPKCIKCGISIKKLTGYVCASPNCPTFLQTTC